MLSRIFLIALVLFLILLLIWMIYKISSQNRQITYLQSVIHRPLISHHEPSIQVPREDIITGVAKPFEVEPEEIAEFVGEQLIEAIRERLAQEQDVPSTRGEEYYETMQFNNHKDDTQNVHDSQVIRELRRRYVRLIELNRDASLPNELSGQVTQDEYIELFIQSMFVELGNYCQSYFDPTVAPEKYDKSQKVIETARQGSLYSGFTDDEGVREDLILAHIWRRIHAPENSPNRDQLLNALMDQIQDAGKYGLQGGPMAAIMGIVMGTQPTPVRELTTECTTGRIGRYFQTFTYLDADPLLCAPIMDEKEFENEAYAKSAKILSKHLEEFPDMAKLYETMEDDLSPEDQARVETMKEEIRTKIRNSITTDYDGIIPQENLDELIKKCVAGV